MQILAAPNLASLLRICYTAGAGVFLSWWKKEACFSCCVSEDSVSLFAERYLVAANMHNNEEVLPHFILQLIHLFAVLPPDTAFLSIYESGSKDSTGVLSPLSESCTCLQAVSARIGLHYQVLRHVLIC